MSSRPLTVCAHHTRRPGYDPARESGESDASVCVCGGVGGVAGGRAEKGPIPVPTWSRPLTKVLSQRSASGHCNKIELCG